jgi:hypothetical protein
MKSINAIFKFGHFYDPNTHKRILIREGAEAVLVMENADVRTLPQVYPGALRDAEALWKEVNSQQKVHASWKVRSCGERLYFYAN